jgi:hypothetical protein
VAVAADLESAEATAAVTSPGDAEILEEMYEQNAPRRAEASDVSR